MPTTNFSDEVVVVIVLLDTDHHRHRHHCIGSTLLTNFYRSIAKSKLNSSNIIINNNIEISNELIYHTKHDTKLISSPQLLYRGSRDGFKAIDFHSKCDNQGPTLTIIKSESSNEPTTNQIFGGFTTQSWKSSNSEYISDDLAFLFKINVENSSNQQQLFRKFNIKQDFKQYAIHAHSNYLTVFGGGHDIYISDDCNLNNNSTSNYGFTYELPNDHHDKFKYGAVDRGYLAGSYNFKVLEIEVFKIITTITSTTSTTITDIQ